jgi:thymidylate synthase (FAD)
VRWEIEPVTILEPHGFVGLEKYCAEDLDVVNAAKASFARYADEMGDAEGKLIGFLLSHRHTSPFEHTFFKFHVRAPISVARDWVRHRIGIAWNEESGRYVQLRDDFYVPRREDVRSQVGKPGAYRFEPLDDEIAVSTGLVIMEDAYKYTAEAYQSLLAFGWAKELARNVLPVGIHTEWLWSCNAHSLMHFLSLRNSTHAMLEIRLYAHAIEEMFAQIMPISHSWFVETERLGQK